MHTHSTLNPVLAAKTDIKNVIIMWTTLLAAVSGVIDDTGNSCGESTCRCEQALMKWSKTERMMYNSQTDWDRLIETDDSRY